MTYKSNGFDRGFQFGKPLTIGLVLIAIGLYLYLIFFSTEDGVMETDWLIRILFIAGGSVFAYFAYLTKTSSKEIESRWLRILFVLSLFAAVSVPVSLIAWQFYVFDDEKVDSYTRFLPFRGAPHISTGATLYYKDIESIRRERTDEGEDIILVSNDRVWKMPGSLTKGASNTFLSTLYRECDWLRDDIENLDDRPVNQLLLHTESEPRTLYSTLLGYGPYHVAFGIIGIWVILIMSTRLILYALKISKRFDLPKDFEFTDENEIPWRRF